jgi:hypothetical protein
MASSRRDHGRNQIGIGALHEAGHAVIARLLGPVKEMIDHPRVSMAIEHVGVSLWERRSLTMAGVDEILGVVSLARLAG